MTVSMPPIHPGKFLAEIIEDLDISQAAFARAAGASPVRVSPHQCTF